MISSVSPSLKYSLSGSGLRFSNGRTTIDFVSGCAFDSFAYSASAKAVADWNRSAGALPSAFITAAATDEGTLDRTVVIGGAGSVTCFASTARGVDALNGGSPANISYNTQANE